MLSPGSHLYFNSYIGSQKPENIRNQSALCPFCDRGKLEGIIARQGDILLVKNKYPVLEDAVQTVLIETADCNSELSVYPKEHLYAVIDFGVRKWLEMEQDDFASVIFYKNHGPYSGGTIRHPHMQIVGLKHIDYRRQVKSDYFTGVPIQERQGVTLNVSQLPKIGFFEFNIVGNTLGCLEQTADYIQNTTHYILHHFNKHCNSYNIFFYHIDHQVLVKIMPRFVTSPLFIGFSIPQVSNRLPDVVKEIQSLYF